MSRIELQILYKEGDVSKLRCTVNKWKFNDAMMGEQYLTFTITSEKPIDWAVGDYCVFRGETFTLNYIPSVTQKAGTKERQDAYTYENVKFDSFLEELTRCQMLDITATTGEYVAALGTNYTGSSKFPLFCGEVSANGRTLTAVCALAAKMQANLDRMYPENGWKIFVDTTSTYVTGSGAVVLVTHTEDKALSFDNTSVAQALAEVHNTFDLDYCVRGRNIYIGYNLKNLTSDNEDETFAFGYGKGYNTREDMNHGLFQIKRVANSQQQIVTRLRALGSTKNMPYRYYNKKYGLSQSLFPTNLQLPDTFATPATKAAHNEQRDQSLAHVKGDTNDAYIDKGNDAAACKEGIREASVRFDGSNSDLPEIYPTIEEATYGELRGALVQDQSGRTGSGSFPNYGDSERIDKILAVGYYDNDVLVNDANKDNGILPESGIDINGVTRSASIGMTNLNYNTSNNGSFNYVGGVYCGAEKTLFTIQGVAPGKYGLAPTHGGVVKYGFNLSCYKDGCGCDVGYIIKVKAKNVQTGITTDIATYNSDFTDITRDSGIKEVELPELPDVKEDTPKVSQISVIALSDIIVTFTPVIKSITVPQGFTDNFSINYQVGKSRVSNESYAPEYTWFPIAESDTLTDTFHVFVQDMGFDFEACWSDDTPKMAMKSGRCVGREFEIGSDVEKVEYGGKKGYMLTLKRAQDSSLNTYYPSQTDPIAAGDHFVLLGIQMPDAYVQMAEVRLLRAATDYLADNCETKFTYQPSIDDIYLQRNLDLMREAGNEKDSIFWRLYAGLKFTFRGIPTNENNPAPLAEITIEKVTISMGESLTPKVELTLNDDVQQGTIQKLTTSVDRIYNGSIFSGGSGNGATGAVSAAMLSILQSEGDKLFLSKVHDDTAAGKITFEDTVTFEESARARKGVVVGRFQSGLLGNGALIDEEGNAEFNSIFSRNFISTPEFRFNRVNVTEGENWCTNGFGTIQSVEVIDDTTGYIDLKLEENDYTSIQVGDICRGIYNDILHQYETRELDDDSELYDDEEEEEDSTETTDEETVERRTFGFSCKDGFFTSYFWVKQFVTNKKGECRFLYELRNAKTPHPCEFMKFAQYGSFTNSERRSSSYSTSIGHYYEMVLDGVSTWKIHSANVVYRKGYLGNMFVTLKNGKEAQLQGYGLYVQDNVYFGNAVVQLDLETLKDLENQLKSYTIDFSEYVNVITVDDVGNVIGGLYTISGRGASQYRQYRIQSAISVRKNDIPLIIAEDGADAGEGTYKIYVQPKGCTCELDNSTIYITSIDNIKDGVAGSSDDTDFDYDAMREMSACSVDIVIDCEGKSSIQKSFPIRIKHDSQPFIHADIDNEFSGVSWNTKTQRYIGLPIGFDLRMWHNDEILNIENVNNVSLSATDGVTLVNGTAPSTPAATSIYYTKSIETITKNAGTANEYSYKIARIQITAMGINVPLVTDINVTASVIYSGIPYERTLVHTINKSTDTNVYQLQPDKPTIGMTYNENKEKVLEASTVYCSVTCDSSDDNHYIVPMSDFSTHHIRVMYEITRRNDVHTFPQNYTSSGVPITTNDMKVTFYLYLLDNNGNAIDTLDIEGVDIVGDGLDGDNAVHLTIDNENDNVLCLEDGTVIASTLPKAKVWCWDGDTKVTQAVLEAQNSWGALVCTGCTAVYDGFDSEDGGRKIKVTAVSAETATVLIPCTYTTKGVSQSHQIMLSIKKDIGTDKYEIVTTPAAVCYNPNTDSFNPEEVVVSIYKTTRDTPRELMPVGDFSTSKFSLEYSQDGGSTWNNFTYGSKITKTMMNVSGVDSIQLRLREKFTKNGVEEWVVRDIEGVDIVGDGTDAAHYYLTSDINSIVKDYLGYFKGSARPTITAWKKVGKEDAVRLADLVDDSGVVAEGMTINAYEMIGNNIAYTNTSETGILTCVQPGSYADRFEVELVKGGKTYAILPIHILQEVKGGKGDDGVGIFPHDCGIFKPGETYYFVKNGDFYIRDMVRYEIGGIMYVFLVKNTEVGTAGVTAAPTSASGDDNWESSGIVETVIANTVFGTNANIGGFMVSEQRMISTEIAYKVEYFGDWGSREYWSFDIYEEDNVWVRPLAKVDDQYYIQKSKGYFTAYNKSQLKNGWREAMDWEIHAASSSVLSSRGNPIMSIPVLEIDGTGKNIIYRDSDDSYWKVNKAGQMTIGKNGGRYGEMSPSTQALSFYKANKELAVVLDSAEYSTIDSIFSNSSGDVSLADGSRSISRTTWDNATGEVWYHYEDISSEYIQVTPNTIIDIIGTIVCSANRQQYRNEPNSYPSYDSTDKKWYIYNCAYAWIIVKVYSDQGCTNLIGTYRTGKEYQVYQNNSQSFTVNEKIVIQEITGYSSGYCKIGVHTQLCVHGNYGHSASVSWSSIKGEVSAGMFMSRVFANGFSFGSSAKNFMAAVQEGSLMHIKALTGNGNYGFEVTSTGLFVIIGGTKYKLTNDSGTAKLTVV